MARILIVDDSATILRTLKLILDKQHKTLTAVNGKDALNVLSHTIVDIIITDIDMPEMGGFELVCYLHADDRYRHLPIIMLTQSSDPADQIQAKMYEVDCYLSKPVSSNELLDTVNRFVLENSDMTKPLPPLPPIDRVALMSLGHGAVELDQFIAKALPSFNQKAIEMVQSLKQAVEMGNMIEVGQISYNFRGKCASLGAVRLEELCFDLSLATRKGATDGLMMKLIEIQAEVARINAYTNTYFS